LARSTSSCCFWASASSRQNSVFTRLHENRFGWTIWLESPHSRNGGLLQRGQHQRELHHGEVLHFVDDTKS